MSDNKLRSIVEEAEAIIRVVASSIAADSDGAKALHGALTLLAVAVAIHDPSN